MNLVLLGATDRSLVVALEDALSDTRRAPRDIVWGWDRPDMTPAPQFGELDLLVVLPDTEWADAWRSHLDRKSTRLNSSHSQQSRMPSSA